MESTPKPTITLSRRNREKVVRHSCYQCNHTTYSLSRSAVDRSCTRTDECKETWSFGVKTAFASTVFSTPIHFEDQLYIFRVKEENMEAMQEAFPEANLYTTWSYHVEDLPFTVRMAKKQDTWYCFDCPCNGGETKTFKSRAGLYNHRKKCSGREY